MKYKAFTLANFKDIPQLTENLSPEEIRDIEIVGHVLPFKANNYVVDELIDWSNLPDDPIFQLTFPQKGMLRPEHYAEMKKVMDESDDPSEWKKVADKIRFDLNPHPDGQAQNVPLLEGERLPGMQHKYDETVLFFPTSSQTCHAYCTFCFRWPQFVGMKDLKFAMKETEKLARYLERHPEVSDVLFTGGDPMVMGAKKLAAHIEPIINGRIPHLRNIRIGTKSLAYWPYKYLTDPDADDTLRLFEKMTKQGYHVAFMAHFNHPAELKTDAVKKAIDRILNTGAQIRTQSPILTHINDDPAVWRDLWRLQVKLGCVPYYMFVARDTGAQHYFAVSLERAWKIYRAAYSGVSGLCRTVRGPSMSAKPGKVQLLGVTEVNGEKAFAMRFIQGRNSDWVARPFFAEYNPDAIWLNDLEPAFGREKFFYQDEMKKFAQAARSQKARAPRREDVAARS